MKRLWQLGDIGADKLALIFGFNLTIWVFFIIPLLAEFFPADVQAKVFYYASGWVQLFALPLMVYVSNKIQAAGDKQDRQQTEMLTELRKNERRQTELITEVRRLLDKNPPSPD